MYVVDVVEIYVKTVKCIGEAKWLLHCWRRKSQSFESIRK